MVNEADDYKAVVNKSDVASVVKEYVAIIAVGISGVGNGKLCSQLNTAISFDEAMYLFEGMWLFLYLLKIDFLSSPRAFMRGLSLAERNTPIAQNFVLYSVYFALAGGYYAGNGGGFVYGCLCIHSHYAIEGR